MPSTPKSLPRWAGDLAVITDRTITSEDAFEVHSAGPTAVDFELLGWWPAPGEVAPLSARVAELAAGNTQHLTLLGTPDEEAAHTLKALGWVLEAHQVLLAAQTDDVDQSIQIPETATLFEAPMDDYDVVEIADFDAPAARGRVRFSEGFALLSEPEIIAPGNTEQFRTAIIANLAAAASGQGLSWLFMVVAADNAAGTRDLRGAGWSNATLLTRWERG